ncbi:MAG: amidohydrolase family protein [Kangiellaceae bacterium]|nr:amidohydrolase family protein [Kangiellaceae bacterium]
MNSCIQLIRMTVCCCFLLPVTQSIADELLVTNVTLISPERSQPLKNASVRIVNGIITEIGSGLAVVNSESQLIDGTGRFLIPGLMDSHVHLSSMPGLPMLDPLDSQTQSIELQLLGEFEQQQPRSYLYFGVTQLLDPSQSNQSIRTFNSQPLHPDLFHCGAVPILSGYPALFSDRRTASTMFDYFVIDEFEKNDFPKSVNPLEHSPEASVKRMANEGAICVKIFVEDGFGLKNDWPLINEHLRKRVIKAAKKHNLLVMAHANAIDMQEIAINHNVDIIAHGLWNWNEYHGQSDLPESVIKLLDRIMERHIVFQPTFNVMDGLRDLLISDVLEQPHYQKVVSPKARDWYTSEAGQWFRKELIKEFGGLTLDSIRRIHGKVISQGERAVEYLYNKGHTMVLASDTPSSPTYAAQPGLSTFKEIKHMAKIGIDLKDILSAATINNARAFNLDKQYGSIELGKIANLLILELNPLESVNAYDKIETVILRGRPIERSQLSVRHFKD